MMHSKLDLSGDDDIEKNWQNRKNTPIHRKKVFTQINDSIKSKDLFLGTKKDREQNKCLT